jgi:hypothetical protein
MFYVGNRGAFSIGKADCHPLARYIDNLHNVDATPQR